MPAGSGPAVSTPATSGSITSVSTNFTISTPVFNTNNNIGTLVTLNLTVTPSATQTITCKLFQTSATGTQVGPAAGLAETLTGTTQAQLTFAFVDTSAFAQNGTGQVYVATFAASTGTGTVAYAFSELETIAPVS
jgi:hypothetical protein